MKFKLLTVSMPLLLMLTACNQAEKYEGYTPVESDTKSQKLYINASTVKQAPNGVVSFSMIIDSGENHIIQTPTTDCINKLTTLEDINSDKKIQKKQEKVSSNTVVLSNKDNAEITKIACEKVVENRMIKDSFSDSKAIEMLYGNYDITTKTATWKNIESPRNFNGHEKFNGKDGLVKILESKDFTQDKNVKHALLTETSLSESSDILIGATIFLKKDNNWLIEKEYFYLIAVDGAIKAAHWKNIGKKNYGIVVEREINDTDDNNAFLFDVNKSRTLVEFDSKNSVSLTFEDTEQDYPDLTIMNGSDEADKDIYKYNNGKYELLGAESLKLLRAQFLEELRKDNKTKIWFEKAFKIGGENFYVIFTKTSTSYSGDFNDCHGCAPNIGAVTYKNVNNEWKLISKQNNFGELGEYGDAPIQDKKIQKFPLKNEKIIFLLNDGHGGMGQFNTGKDVLMFMNNNWYFKGYITTSEDFITGIDECDKESINQCWSYDGKVSIIEGKKEIPDFLVTKNGTNYDEKKSRITRSKNSLYTYNGQEYIEKEDPIELKIKNENESLKPIFNNGSLESDLVIKMINYAMNTNSENNEIKIEEVKQKIEKFPKIKVKNKKEARVLNDKGLDLSKAGNLEGAIKMFEDGHNLNPSDVEILNNLGFTLMKFGNFDEAQKAIITALTISPDRSVAWNTLGDIFAHKGEIDRAVACFFNSIKFSKDKFKYLQLLKKWNENEDDPNLKQARMEIINIEKNRNSLLKTNINVNNKSAATNEDIGEFCEAVALVDAYAGDFDNNGVFTKLDTSSILKKGEILHGVTQYLVNSDTHESSACQYNGYCYIANKNLNGDITQTIQFTNCNVGVKYPHQDGEFKNLNSYQLLLDRSKFSDEFLTEYDMKNKLNNIGITPYIADNAVPFSINNPNSTCANYVNKALEGVDDAIKKLNSNGGQYCSEFYVEDMLEKFLYRKDGYWTAGINKKGVSCQSLIEKSERMVVFTSYSSAIATITPVPGDLYPTMQLPPSNKYPNGINTREQILSFKSSAPVSVKVTETTPNFRFDMSIFANGNSQINHYQFSKDGQSISEYKLFDCIECSQAQKNKLNMDRETLAQEKVPYEESSLHYNEYWCNGANIHWKTQ